MFTRQVTRVSRQLPTIARSANKRTFIGGPAPTQSETDYGYGRYALAALVAAGIYAGYASVRNSTAYIGERQGSTRESAGGGNRPSGKDGDLLSGIVGPANGPGGEGVNRVAEGQKKA